MADRKDLKDPRARDTQGETGAAVAPLRGGSASDSNDRGGRGVGATVTAGAIGMGLAAQSGSEGGMQAFAAPQPVEMAGQDDETAAADAGRGAQPSASDWQVAAVEGPADGLDLSPEVTTSRSLSVSGSDVETGASSLASPGAAFLVRDDAVEHRVEAATPSADTEENLVEARAETCLLYTSPSPRDA